jgi:hypothetical protein
MTRTNSIFRRFWWACPQLQAALVKHCQQFEDVLDIGPGVSPFPAATRGVQLSPPTLPDFPITQHDLLTEIPDGMLNADFVYCRHVVEDLYNPVPLLEGLKKCKTGYLETPSPAAELGLGIDNNDTGMLWPGYRHHHWICWTVNNKPPLYLTPKYTWTSNLYSPAITNLLDNPMYWNTGLLWDNYEFDYKILLNERDFSVTTRAYPDMLGLAIAENIDSQQALYRQLCPPEFDPWADHDYEEFNLVTLTTPVEDHQAVFDLAKMCCEELPYQPVFVEIGVWAGSTTQYAVKAGCKCFAVDTWEGSHSDFSGMDADRFGGDNILRAFCKNMRADLFTNVFPLKGTSQFWANAWPKDLPIDFVYIDADHEYIEVKRDIEYWTPLVRKGGIIAGHDYNLFPGVNKAVEETGPFEHVGKHVWWRRKE